MERSRRGIDEVVETIPRSQVLDFNFTLDGMLEKAISTAFFQSSASSGCLGRQT